MPKRTSAHIEAEKAGRGIAAALFSLGNTAPIGVRDRLDKILSFPVSNREPIAPVRVTVGHLHVEVSDHGTGLPDGFDIDQPRASLGFKVVTGMVRQLQGHLTLSNNQTGTRFLLDLPILSHLHESSSV